MASGVGYVETCKILGESLPVAVNGPWHMVLSHDTDGAKTVGGIVGGHKGSLRGGKSLWYSEVDSVERVSGVGCVFVLLHRGRATQQIAG